MSNAVHADPSERLPWLSDAARPQPRQSRRSWYPLVIAASAAGAIAFGGWTIGQRSTAPAPAPVRSVQTVPLPPPLAAAPADAQPRPVSEREALRPQTPPSSAAAVAPAPPRERARTAAPRRKAAGPTRSAQASVPAAKSAAPPYDPKAWNSGVRGRIIQLGAFQTPAQAQAEWRRVYARYPLLRPLSPRVLKSRIRGRTYHRLQLGTFSHAHSELLCQRLRVLGEGCMVLGLGPRRG
ncbi:MAG: SPOR domain-containing protein [Sphingomicrobium sp.]